MRKFGRLVTSCLVLTSIALSSCGKEPTSKPSDLFLDLHIEMSWWDHTGKARQAYPNLHPNEASDIYTKNLRSKYFREEENLDKRHLMAAIIYLDYTQKNTRALTAKCESLGVDISAFKSSFEHKHESEDITVDKILEQHTISRDTVWNRNKLEMMGNASTNLWVIDDLLKRGGFREHNLICADIKNEPDTYARPFNFAKDMPIVAAVLKQTEALAVNKHTELKSVPELRR